MITVPEEIKRILHQDNSQSNIRIHFPNGERTDICNDLIVMNSVTFKESLCSQNEFKFGLVESPIFECEVVGVSNIVGATVEITCEVFCPASVDGAVWQNDIQQYVYSIKYGTFVVQSAERQTDLLHRKIVCYNSVIDNNGMVLNDLELWKQQIDMYYVSGGAVNVDSVYTPNLFYLLWSQIKGDVSLLGRQLTSNTLKEQEDSFPGQMWGHYHGSNVPFTVELWYKVFYFGLPEYSWRQEYNNSIDYPAKFFISENANKDYFKEFMNYCNTYLIVPSQDPLSFDRIKSPILIRSEHRNYTGANYTDYYKSRDLSDFKIYPYINDYFYSYNYRIDVYLLTKIDIRPAQSSGLPETIINVIDENVVGKYYYTTLTNAENLTYNIPIVDGPQGWRINYTDFDLQSIMNAYMELNGAFGYLNRNAGLDIMNIKEKFNLVPSDTLYPGTALYPQKVTGGSILPQDYESCWYGDVYRKPYGMIIATYKYLVTVGGEVQEATAMYRAYINGFSESNDENSYLTYVLDNVILQHEHFEAATISAFCTKIAEVLTDIKYMPVKLVGRGLPYVEAGDTFEVLTPTNDSITTIVLSRTLKGEMVLQDEYTSVS